MPNEADRQQLMRIMDINDDEENYFLRIDPTPPVREDVPFGVLTQTFDSATVIDSKNGNEVVKYTWKNP